MCTTRIPGMWIFTFLNSFIHTLMYYYFTLTCLGYRPKWKRHLTTMQITQFLIGNVFGIGYLVTPNCYNWDSNFRENILHHKVFGTYRASIIFTFAFNVFFVGTLIALFNDFARRTYGQKKAVSSEHQEPENKENKKVKSSKPKKEKEVPASAVKKGRKTSPVQIATSVVIEPEASVESVGPVESVKAAAKTGKVVKTIKPGKSTTTTASRSKSRARSTVRAKSQARASSPAKATANSARKSRRAQ